MELKRENVGELDRTTYLGSSDAAAIIGMSTWKTPLEVYLEKIGRAEPPTEEKLKFFARRKRQEPIVIEQLMEERAVSIVATNQRYVHPAVPYIAAEIDFEFEVTAAVVESCPGIPPALIGTFQNGEIKTSSHFAGAQFGEEGSDEIPVAYCAQSQHAMGVTGKQICLYAVMTGFDNFATYVLHRDEETITALTAKEVAFWNDHILPRIPPAPINNDDLKLLFAKHNGRPVEIDTFTMRLLDRLNYLRDAGNAIDKEIDDIKFEIGIFCAKQWGLTAPENAEDDAVLMYNGEPVAKWRKQRGASFDQKKFKIDHPYLYEQYMREYFFRVIPKRKKA